MTLSVLCYPSAGGACGRPPFLLLSNNEPTMNSSSPAPRDEDHHRVTDLFSPNDAHADPRSQRPAAEPATRPSVGGSPASFAFANPLFSTPRDPRANTPR